MTTESPTARPRFTLPELAAMKPKGEKIVMVTAYDAPGARLADEVGIELILVGDSAAMVVLGHDSTVPATVDEMIAHFDGFCAELTTTTEAEDELDRRPAHVSAA